MKKQNENTYTLVGAVIAAVIVIWMIMMSGCSSVKDNPDLHPYRLLKPTAPFYGPHTSTTMTNHEWDIERRNIYSDGWQDKERSLNYER